jgi:putative AdoMet-dependent methyltransferase
VKYVCPLIVVKNMKTTRNFYEEMLGQKVKYDFGENVTFEGDFAIHFEEHYLGLLGESNSKVLRKTHDFELYFETDEIESILEKLKEKNVEFLHEVREQPWGQRVMRFYDPDLHIIEVGETMESVVLRYHETGMSIVEISNRTSMPTEFINKVISPSKWYFDELKQVGVDYADIKNVEEYDSGMQNVRDIKEEVEEIATAIDLKAEQVIIDIGTGTGEFGIEVSKYCKKVIALDVSRTMLNFANEKAKKQERSNIEFIHGGFLTYIHQGEAVDAVITQLALHHLPDFWKMVALKRISEMLKDGGKLYLRDVVFPSGVVDYGNFFNQIIDKLKIDVGDKNAEETKIHIKEEFSTLDWIMEELLKKAGFTIDEVNYFNGFLATYVCTKKKGS